MPVGDYRSPAPGTLPVDTTERRLLHSVVEVARSVFGAAAASVFLVDQNNGDLVFEAVSGEGEQRLPGTRFERGTGIAGWVAASGQPMLADHLGRTGSFALDAAETTGYIPQSIMAAPLLRDSECIGVLEVLDRGSRPRAVLQDVELLGLVATQAALGLELLVRLQWAVGTGTAESADLAVLQRIAERLPLASSAAHVMVSGLLSTIDALLADDQANRAA
ncbi:GAF domain-containing protein [Micromonospora sp. MS34]|uniref:GAF domain-containing protein n=1 Tax=Micromonospora sp. MS34 TaxID=3385971 RepID=UPI0039A173D3